MFLFHHYNDLEAVMFVERQDSKEHIPKLFTFQKNNQAPKIAQNLNVKCLVIMDSKVICTHHIEAVAPWHFLTEPLHHHMSWHL